MYKYLQERLGKSLIYVSVIASFGEEGVEVEVAAEASPLVNGRRLKALVDEAAMFGIVLATLVRELGWPLDRRTAVERALKQMSQRRR